MSKLPIELISLIMLYVSTPVADLFKREIKEIKEEFIEMVENSFNTTILTFSFAEYYFYSKHCYEYGIIYMSNDIYRYCNMDSDYVDTFIEYYQNH